MGGTEVWVFDKEEMEEGKRWMMGWRTPNPLSSWWTTTPEEWDLIGHKLIDTEAQRDLRTFVADPNGYLYIDQDGHQNFWNHARLKETHCGRKGPPIFTKLPGKGPTQPQAQPPRPIYPLDGEGTGGDGMGEGGKGTGTGAGKKREAVPSSPIIPKLLPSTMLMLKKTVLSSIPMPSSSAPSAASIPKPSSKAPSAASIPKPSSSAPSAATIATASDDEEMVIIEESEASDPIPEMVKIERSDDVAATTPKPSSSAPSAATIPKPSSSAPSAATIPKPSFSAPSAATIPMASDDEKMVSIEESEASDPIPETMKIEQSDDDVPPTYQIQAYFRTMEYVDPNLPTEDSASPTELLPTEDPDSPTELPCPF